MMNKLDIPKIEDFIKSLPEKDLRYLNHLIIDRMNLLSQMRSSESMAKFHKSQPVQFESNNGELIKGTIVKMNKKTIVVRTVDGIEWKVSPGLLRALD